jgi:formylmethanofuran dehydrogenase subunit A
MGYTTVVEPAVLPANALDAHLQMSDIPIIDTAGLAILGSDDYLLRLIRGGLVKDRSMTMSRGHSRQLVALG